MLAGTILTFVPRSHTQYVSRLRPPSPPRAETRSNAKHNESNHQREGLFWTNNEAAVKVAPQHVVAPNNVASSRSDERARARPGTEVRDDLGLRRTRVVVVGR